MVVSLNSRLESNEEEEEEEEEGGGVGGGVGGLTSRLNSSGVLIRPDERLALTVLPVPYLRLIDGCITQLQARE